MTVSRRAYNAVMNTAGVDTNTITVGVDADTNEGDLMIAITCAPTGTPTGTGPDGFTLMSTQTSGTALQSNLYKRIATDAEPANYTWTFTQTGTMGVALITFVGAHDILSYDALVQATEASPNTRQMDAARDAVAYLVSCWRDGATSTMTGNTGSEDFDVVSNNAAATIYRGMAGSYFGPGVGGLTDVINIGDSLPGATWTPSGGTLDNTINWVVLVDNKAPDTEPWSSTDGAFAVELELDRVELDSLGGVDTIFRGDVTGEVAAFFERGENAPNEVTENLADGLATTKWLDFSDTSYVTYDFGANNSKTIKRYRLTSANDQPDRDPYNWTLEGSADNTNWTVLDTRTGESFANRAEVREFNVTTPGSYRYYKLNIASNRSPSTATSTQLAEFRLSTHSVWEDVTSYVVEEDKIRITRGLQGASGRSDYSRAYVTFDNRDGRFSIENQGGAYYGSLQRNTLMRISKAYGTKTLQLQGAVRLEGTNMCGDGVRCPLTSALSITGDIDVRMDFEPGSWRDEQMLCGIQTQNNEPTHDARVSWYLTLEATGKLTWTHSTGSATVTYTSTQAVASDSGRLAVRVTVDVDNGSSGSTARFYTSSSISGTWTQLGDAVTESGTTSIAYTGGALCVGHVGSQSARGLHGEVYHFELRTGIGGTLVSDVDFTAITNGAHEFEENGNRWVTVNNAVVSNRHYRFHGEVAEWPLAWDHSGRWIYASVVGAGVQRRWERTTWKVSAMRRYHNKAIISNPGAFERYAEPAAYWPMEEKKGVYRISSGLPGKPSMQLYPTLSSPKFDQQDGQVFNESEQLMRMGDAKMGGRVVGATSGYADMRWVQHTVTDPGPDIYMFELYSTGTLKRWIISYNSADQWRIRGYDEDDSGSFLWDTGNQSITTVGEAAHFRLTMDQNGSSVDVTLTAVDVYGTSLGSFSDSFPAATMGRITWVNVNPNGDIDDAYIGHIAVYGVDSPSFTEPLNAYHYETAGNRIKRLTQETQVEFRHIGDLDTTAYMGFYDSSDTSFSAMSSAAVTDEGFLIDPLDAFGIEYRTLRSLLNQAAHLTLSYSGGELSNELTPVADDSFIVNDFTASRGGAGSRRFRLTSGPLSVDAPPYGVNTYDDEQSYSLAHEGQCVDIASWVVHRGTLDEYRFPRIEIALENLRIAADTALIERILRLDVGDRVDITDTPDFLPAQDIRQVAVGYEEWFDNFQHNFKINTQPERLYEAALYDGWSHFEGDDSSLYQDISSSTTTVLVQNASGPEWTGDVESMPFEVKVDGEVMKVQAAGSGVTTNSDFDTDTTDWEARSSTITRDTTIVHPHPLAVASLKVTPNGVAATGGATQAITGAMTAYPQNDYRASMWVYSPAGWSDLRPTLEFYDSGNNLLTQPTGSAFTASAGVWTYMEQDFTAPASTAKVLMRVRHGSTPAASDVYYVWSAKVTEVRTGYDSSWSGDSFNRANSATVLGDTDGVGTIRTWTQNAGTWGIDTNRAYISAAGTSIATITGAADLEELSMEVPVWASGEAFLVFRYTSTSAYMRFGGTVGAAATLITRTGGADTTTYTADGTDGLLAAGDTLMVRCSGSVIECYRNGKMILCVSDTTNETNTGVGMRLATTAPRIDNFYVLAGGALQPFKVERGRNGTTAYHKAGAKFALLNKPYRGM